MGGRHAKGIDSLKAEYAALGLTFVPAGRPLPAPPKTSIQQPSTLVVDHRDGSDRPARPAPVDTLTFAWSRLSKREVARLQRRHPQLTTAITRHVERSKR